MEDSNPAEEARNRDHTLRTTCPAGAESAPKSSRPTLQPLHQFQNRLSVVDLAPVLGIDGREATDWSNAEALITFFILFFNEGCTFRREMLELFLLMLGACVIDFYA